MRIFSLLRVMLVALLVCIVSESAHAGVFISVGFAPPLLPVYVQPPCPEPGWMWIPGYWAYGPDGYYWVPGTWVPAPEPDLYWTPGYWGWNAGLYTWYPGYWGPTVGYYGGVNYGYGYFGTGFVGGMWRGGAFDYNTAVMHVDRRMIHNVYEDRNVIRTHTVARDNRVAFSGGPGGIHHEMTAEERGAMQQRHFGATSYQMQHKNMAMHDTNLYFNHNHGQPSTMAVARPMGAGSRGPTGRESQSINHQRGAPQAQPAPQTNNRSQPQYRSQQRPYNQAQPQYRPQQRPYNQAQPQYRSQQQPYNQAQPQYRSQQQPYNQAQPQYRPQQQPYDQAQPRYRPEEQP